VRRTIGPILALVVVAAGLVTLWTYLGHEEADAALVLVEVSGDVVLTGPDIAVEAASGVRLVPLQRVATGENARAILALGDETRIRIGPTASVQVQEIEQDGVTLELEEGALHAVVRPNSGALRVASRGREILATDAEFDAGVRDDHLVFEVERGDAMVLGVERASLLQQGERLTVGADGGPTVGAIPDDLLLEVEWPEERRTRAEAATLTGTTEPGALVQVKGGAGQIEVVADASGVFQATVPLWEGDNTVRVEAIDVLGNQVAVEGEMVRDTRGPGFRGGVEYGP